MEDLEAAKVIPCWPKPGEAGVQPAERFVRAEVKDWLLDPRKCLLPQTHWPASPPQSRVRASDREWELIVEAAYERGMMRRVYEDEILRDTQGRLVLNGAGGVRKLKTIDGVEQTLQRFISILVPSNSYQEHMIGDDCHLQYLGQMSMMRLGEEEMLLLDSKDLTSCFNLFSLPESWGGMLTFSKQVDARVFGGTAGEMAWVGMTVVPMGWINSVALMQTVVRSLVFEESGIPPDSEISKLKRFPTDSSASLVYLDSLNNLRKIERGLRETLEGQGSARHESFVQTCQKYGLALNSGKRLVGAVRGTLQGGVSQACFAPLRTRSVASSGTVQPCSPKKT